VFGKIGLEQEEVYKSINKVSYIFNSIKENKKSENKNQQKKEEIPMESQLEVNEERLKYLEKINQELPDLMMHESAKWDEVYKDGALSTKVKRLMALGIALRARCVNCIIGQTMRALEAGASKEEILETIAVNMAMSGTTGIAESLRVLKLLDELGKL